MKSHIALVKNKIFYCLIVLGFIHYNILHNNIVSIIDT